MFWVEGYPEGHILRAGKDGSDRCVFAAGQLGAKSVAVSGNQLFWTNMPMSGGAPLPGQVMRKPVAP